MDSGSRGALNPGRPPSPFFSSCPFFPFCFFASSFFFYFPPFPLVFLVVIFVLSFVPSCPSPPFFLFFSPFPSLLLFFLVPFLLFCFISVPRPPSFLLIRIISSKVPRERTLGPPKTGEEDDKKNSPVSIVVITNCTFVQILGSHSCKGRGVLQMNIFRVITVNQSVIVSVVP